MHAVAIEGLLGRIVGDVLLHYFNTVGAYIVCGAVVAVAMYLSTAFSFVNMQIWLNTRFAFVLALWQRFQDWRAARAKATAQKKAEKEAAKAAALRNANERGVIVSPAQLARRRAAADAAAAKTGIERTFEDEEPLAADAAMQAAFAEAMDSAAGNAGASAGASAGSMGAAGGDRRVDQAPGVLALRSWRTARSPLVTTERPPIRSATRSCSNPARSKAETRASCPGYASSDSTMCQ